MKTPQELRAISENVVAQEKIRIKEILQNNVLPLISEEVENSANSGKFEYLFDFDRVANAGKINAEDLQKMKYELKNIVEDMGYGTWLDSYGLSIRW